MTVYDIAIHNKLVRESVETGEVNKTPFRDDWSDIHYFEMEAASEEEARSKLKERYPEEQGFVISEVVVIPELT